MINSYCCLQGIFDWRSSRTVKQLSHTLQIKRGVKETMSKKKCGRSCRLNLNKTSLSECKFLPDVIPQIKNYCCIRFFFVGADKEVRLRFCNTPSEVTK